MDFEKHSNNPPISVYHWTSNCTLLGNDGSQPGPTAASPEALARPVPSAAQAMVPGTGRTEEDADEGSPGVVVLGERFASTPLTPSIAGGASRREGSAVLGAG